jgi:hypothetical protein
MHFAAATNLESGESMSKLITIITVVVLFCGSASAFQNEPDGFRGVTWSAPFGTVSTEMSLKENAGDNKYYLRKNDKLEIGGASLATIAYGFWRGKFDSVYIKTEGIANQQALIEAFKAQFGQPSKPNRFMDRYYWFGAITTISLDCNSVTSDCVSFISSTEVRKEQGAEEKNKAKGAAGDF